MYICAQGVKKYHAIGQEGDRLRPGHCSGPNPQPPAVFSSGKSPIGMT